ncbi:MAG: tetratricopeptide repeat protein [Oleiphilus sp.]
MRIVLFILSFALLAQYASSNTSEKVDYVALGSTLVKDGYIQRAKTILDKVDVKKPDFDFATYYTLKGILLHKTGYPVLSNIFFDTAIEKGQTKASIYLYKARNYWQKMQYEKVIEAMDKAGQAAKDNPQMLVIKAEAYKQLGKMESAWAVLDEGIALHPDYSRFYSQKFYYLLELGFYQTAQDYAQKYLESEKYSAKEYLAVGFAFRENGQHGSAAALLEEGVIKYSDDEKLLELLGQVYIDQEKYLNAALVFDWASIRFPQFAAKAATLYLKSNDPVRSLQLNRRISQQDEKFRQRVGIDIHLEDYESMVAKTESLKRYDLLSDENILYALGFAHFRNGDYEQARSLLKQITDNQLFAKASHLFKQIEICQNDPYACR